MTAATPSGPSGKPRFVRLPDFMTEYLPSDQVKLQKALFWGLDIARSSLAWDVGASLYGGFDGRNTRLNPGDTWLMVEAAAEAFGLPVKQVVCAALHFGLHDAYSPAHSPAYRARLASMQGRLDPQPSRRLGSAGEPAAAVVPAE